MLLHVAVRARNVPLPDTSSARCARCTLHCLCQAVAHCCGNSRHGRHGYANPQTASAMTTSLACGVGGSVGLLGTNRRHWPIDHGALANKLSASHTTTTTPATSFACVVRHGQDHRASHHVPGQHVPPVALDEKRDQVRHQARRRSEKRREHREIRRRHAPQHQRAKSGNRQAVAQHVADRRRPCCCSLRAGHSTLRKRPRAATLSPPAIG